MELISVRNKSGVPKYKQIVKSIEKAISIGLLKVGDPLPSLNYIRDEHKVSRDTVVSAFNELKVRGIVNSVVGKGYYVASCDVKVERKVFMLFDEFNSFKEDIYNAFLEEVGTDLQVDIFFHHFNIEVFDKLVSMSAGNYNAYVLMPSDLAINPSVINNLPPNEVYILDQTNPELSDFPSVHQNFEKIVYEGLLECTELLKKYDLIVLINSSDNQPSGISRGFERFCKINDFRNEMVSSVPTQLKVDTAYLILDDKILVQLIKNIKSASLKISEEVGIIAYNDSLLKEVFEGGITTISTNFTKMGQRLAQMILNNEDQQIENDYRVSIRKSL